MAILDTRAAIIASGPYASMIVVDQSTVLSAVDPKVRVVNGTPSARR